MGLRKVPSRVLQGTEATVYYHEDQKNDSLRGVSSLCSENNSCALPFERLTLKAHL